MKKRLPSKNIGFGVDNVKGLQELDIQRGDVLECGWIAGTKLSDTFGKFRVEAKGAEPYTEDGRKISIVSFISSESVEVEKKILGSGPMQVLLHICTRQEGCQVKRPKPFQVLHIHW